nr:BSD domain-containing protein 1 isoform X6 [Aotus nancymaae]
MAEGEDVGWWRSWLQQSYQAVKEKSSEALEFMKRDLTEFTQVVQHDTACTIAATANVVKEKLAIAACSRGTCFLCPFSIQTEGSSGATEKMKKGLSDFLGVISDTFAPSPDKTIDCDVITLMGTPSGTAEPYDGTKARLYSLQSDPATYCNEPDGPPELFEAWLSQFCLEEKKGEISELLVGSPSIRALYTKMVPAAVSHSEFWHRYFYKVHQLEQEQARRDVLKQRAEQSISEEPGWEEEDGSSTDISEDWEKDFDLDMTEEEVQMALSKVDASGEVSGPGGSEGSEPSGTGCENYPQPAQLSAQEGPCSCLRWHVVGKKLELPAQSHNSGHQQASLPLSSRVVREEGS